jgi:hypothetical protein
MVLWKNIILKRAIFEIFYYINKIVFKGTVA